MADSPETAYRVRFAPLDDGTVAVTVTMSLSDSSEPSPLGWFSDATKFELGPVKLSDEEATRLLEKLQAAIELVASADAKRRAIPSTDAQQSSEENEATGPLGRPSELRLRR